VMASALTSVKAIGQTDWRHGARLAIAVVIAFLVSTSFGLPESFWAVMSALIVVRPTAGSTLGAGWDRVRGTMTGTVVGLGGVWLHHSGLGSAASTLAIIAIVAFMSAVVPAMRSAPISALIILTSGGIPGHSALDVAGLRAIEIMIGVATGLLVSLLAFAVHARERFDETCAGWLNDAARRASDDLLAVEVKTSAEREADASRKALRALAELAVGADREERWFAFVGRRAPSTIQRQPIARMLVRVANDLSGVVRAAACAPTPLDEAFLNRLTDAIRDAMTFTASAFEPETTRSRALMSSLREWSAADGPVAWLAAPTRLLLQDLVHLRRIASSEVGEKKTEVTT
jgi:Fusaric acid resistance protein family